MCCATMKSDPQIDIGEIITVSRVGDRNKIINTGVLHNSDIPNLQLALPAYGMLLDCVRAFSALRRSFMSMQISVSTLSISRTAQ